jgi:pantoate--beta-alanine ligase
MTKVFYTRLEFDQYRNTISDKTIGLVPTMGNLHEGHISLLKSSLDENDISIMTIYVNPKQFGPSEDFDQYPRTLENDLNKINELISNYKTQKEVIIFAPKSNEEIYPNNFSTTISIGEIKNILCGKVRPIHFDGVTTVVYRLFAITKPTTAYFGQKDYQQCVIIQKLIHDLELPILIKIKPIVRNAQGLALSSRNQYLSLSEQEEALHLPNTLNKIVELIKSKRDYKSLIQNELTDLRWDYLEVLDGTNLKEVNSTTKKIVVVAALKINKTRLLDNILVDHAG